MLERYLLNIEGCIKKYSDWDTAEAWLSRAQKELKESAFKQLLDGVYSLAVLHPSNELQVEGVLALLAKFDAIGSKERRAGILLAREKLELEKRKEAERQQQARVREEQERIAEVERARLREQRAEAAAREKERLQREKEAAARHERERLQREKEKKAAHERVLAQLAEQERLRQEEEARAREKLRQEHFTNIDRLLETDFLALEGYFHSVPEGLIERKELDDRKQHFVSNWFVQRQRHCPAIKHLPDGEQSRAIAAVNGHVHVVARAGSGKTATLVYRALFLVEHCGVDPRCIMLLAFNREAANTMRNRLSRLLDNTAEPDVLHRAEHGKNGPTKRHERTGSHLSAMLPHVLTFHALGYSFAPLAGDILMDDDDAAEHALSDVVSGIIIDHLRVPSFRESIRMLMLAHFREDWNRLIESHYLLSREQFLQYRRSLPQESLKGEYVKSFGEKLIADFLFEYGIEYNYEWNHGWGERAYRPDFTLPRAGSGGLIIEYFGMSGDSAYDQTSQKKRGYWQLNSGWELIELTQHDIGAAGASAFKANLKRTLEARGVSCEKRGEDQIWEDIKVRAIGRYTKAMVGFIGRCRKLSMSPERLRGMIDAYHSETEAESLFLELAHAFYLAYLEHLSQTGKTDFDGLIQFAAAAISADHTTFHRASGSGDVRALRYIFIDEFQDFSPLFHRLLCAIGRVNPNAELFCVGDDWQAINGFAGSDLKYFNQFQRYIGNCHRVHITTNYRSTRSVVDVGNALMHGKGQPARPSPEAQQGTVLLADLSDFKPSPAELLEYKWDALTPMVLRLVGESLGKNSRVVLLTRRTTIPRFSQTRGPEDSTLGKFADTLRRQFPKESRGNIHVVNTHKFKGGQGDTVIVMDALERSYPLVHPDWWFSRIFGESLEGIVDEERRLFYVALTRAVDKLIIVTEKQSSSPFLNELDGICKLKRIEWSLYPPIPRRTSEVIVTVGNQKQRGSEPTAVLKERLRAAQYDWFGAALPGWAKSFPAKGFSIARLQEEIWSQSADGVEVLVSDEFETLIGRFWINAGQWVTCFDKLDSVCALQQEG